jgi:hypothetical protein
VLHFENPLRGIRNVKRVKKLPDPLSVDESEAILVDLDPGRWLLGPGFGADRRPSGQQAGHD